MKREWNDEELKEAFQDLRERDALGAPPFSAVHDAALARPRRGVPWMRAALAAAVVLAAVGVFAVREREARPPAPSLSNWRSPTEFLLKSQSDYLMTTVPILPAHPRELDVLGIHPSAPRDS